MYFRLTIHACFLWFQVALTVNFLNSRIANEFRFCDLLVNVNWMSGTSDEFHQTFSEGYPNRNISHFYEIISTYFRHKWRLFSYRCAWQIFNVPEIEDKILNTVSVYSSSSYRSIELWESIYTLPIRFQKLLLPDYPHGLDFLRYFRPVDKIRNPVKISNSVIWLLLLYCLIQYFTSWYVAIALFPGVL